MDSGSEGLKLSELQDLIQSMFGHKDEHRGIEGTFMWFMEEVGELSAALRKDDRENLKEEFADTLAWLVTLANLADVDLNQAIQEKYQQGCPRCHQLICRCHLSAKP